MTNETEEPVRQAGERAERDARDEQLERDDAGGDADHRPRRRDRHHQRELGGDDQLRPGPEPVHRRCRPERGAGRSARSRGAACAARVASASRFGPAHGCASGNRVLERFVARDAPGFELDDAIDEPGRQVVVVRDDHERDVVVGAASRVSSVSSSARPFASSPANGSSSTIARGCAARTPGQHDPAHLTAAQLVDAPAGELVGVEPDRGQRGARRGVVDAARGADLVEHGGAQHLQARVLERQTDPADLIRDRPAVEQRRALARRDAGPRGSTPSVDLPEPLCPTTTIASPAWIVRSTSVSARFAHGVPRE